MPLYCYRFPKNAYHFGPLEAESPEVLAKAVWPHWKDFTKNGEQLKIEVWEVTPENYVQKPPQDVLTVEMPCPVCDGTKQVMRAAGGGRYGAYMTGCTACAARDLAKRIFESKPKEQP